MRTSLHAAAVRAAFVGMLATLLAGCVHVGPEADAPAIRRHALDLLPPPTVQLPDGVHTLAVRDFDSRRRYEARVVRRTPEGALTFLENERFVEDPRECVTTVVREALAQSGAFRLVVPASGGFETDLLLDGNVLAFDLVEPKSGPWTAHLALRLTLADAHGGVLSSAALDAERPLPGPSPEGLGPALGACLREVLDRALAAWREAGVLTGDPAPDSRAR